MKTERGQNFKKQKKMKKFIFIFVLALLASCGNPGTPEKQTNETIEQMGVGLQPEKSLMVAESSSVANVLIDGDTYVLNVFQNGSKQYSTTSELQNGEHTMTSFVYDGVEYLQTPLNFTVDNAIVKQISINNGTPGRSLIYEDLDFGYIYAEFEEPEMLTIPFHVIIGVPDSLLPFYQSSNYRYQPEGLQTLMKGIFRVQYYHDSTHVATYGVLDYHSGAVNVQYLPGGNFFRVQHLRYLPGVGMVEVVGNDYTITGELITGDNGVVNIEIMPSVDWVQNANYPMFY